VRAHESQRLARRFFRQVHRHALEDEEGALRAVVAVPRQDLEKIVVLKVDRHVGQV
jgi:hypothetical protein